jgi:hypothetical protein
MRPLPYDYARCIAPDCPRADRCRRKTPGRQDGYPQAMIMPDPKTCEEFIGDDDNG